MTTTDPRADLPRPCPSLGVDAVPLDRFADIETEDGQRLLYDRDEETAWVQSDLYVSLAAMI